MAKKYSEKVAQDVADALESGTMRGKKMTDKQKKDNQAWLDKYGSKYEVKEEPKSVEPPKVDQPKQDTSQTDALQKMMDDFNDSIEQQRKNEEKRLEEERKTLDAGLKDAKENTFNEINKQSEEVSNQALEAQHISGVRGRLASQSLDERIAQKGLAGNMGMQMQADNSNATLNRARGIEAQETDMQNQLIEAKIQAEKDYETALATGDATLKAQSLDRINAINNQAMTMGLQIEQMMYDRTRQAEQDEMTRNEYEYQQQKRAEENEAANLEYLYGDDYTARINELMETDPTDPMLPYLFKLREEKVGSQKSAEAKAAEAAYDSAMEQWKMQGVANEYVASIIGVPVGTATSDYSYKQATITLNERKFNDSSAQGWANIEISKERENRLQNEANGSGSDEFKVISSGVKEVLDSVSQYKQTTGVDGSPIQVRKTSDELTSEKQQVGADYLADLYIKGIIDTDMADKLALQHGINIQTVADIIQNAYGY